MGGVIAGWRRFEGKGLRSQWTLGVSDIVRLYELDRIDIVLNVVMLIACVMTSIKKLLCRGERSTC